jgi:serine/threonine protein kinase/tetratricopeptide (TPR) repeat protein
MDENPQREEELFEAALALPAAERRVYLERACAGDVERLQRVEALLRAHEDVSGFLETPALAELSAVARAANRDSPPSESPGDRIGRYKLLQKIGEGGCGVVFMAEQEEPIRRRVALKVIKLGMDTKEVIARFEAERQALAMMDHPNIARVFDAGATDTGRPFFVMELVRGIRITDYCDQQNLSTAERLNLFVQVCHAIQHAHQKGIIHRDIKPSNILVTLQDGQPLPKVIDFGIAKATQGRLTDQTFFTAFEQFIGTPAYMSPEQVQLSSQDVDTRSDIYSLGVLLYELLTSQTPFETQELLKAGLDEMRRRIREVEPPKPSTRLRTLEADAMTATAEHRATVPPKLVHLIRGDLDWIVMRCLEKNRARRYPTADELARDLERHLHDEPVAACPPGKLYRFQKLIRRNKLVVSATAAIAAALVIGLAVSSWMYSRERAARERAVTAELQQSELHRQAEAARERAVAAEEQQRRLRQQAEEARANEARQRTLAEEARSSEARQRELAEGDRKNAESEASKSRQVAQFLADMLQGVGPEVALGRDTKLLREILDKTAERVGRDFKDQPAVEAQLRATLGGVYQQLGEYEMAESMYRGALAIQRKLLGDDNSTVAMLLENLGHTLSTRGDLAGAEAMEREALAMRRKVLGKEDPDVASSLDSMGEILMRRGDLAGAEAMEREALAMQRKLLGNEAPRVSTTLHNLAQVLTKRGDYAEAEAMLREALALQRKLAGDEHPSVATALDSLASVLLARGDLAGAEAMDRQALAMQRKLLGNEHPELAVTLNNLAGILGHRGDLGGAEAMLREALAMKRKLSGNEHPEVAASLGSLGAVLMERGDLGGAEAMIREALAMQRKLLGSEHPEVATSLNNLALVLSKRGDFAGAEAMDREALAMQRRVLGDEHPEVAAALVNLATVLRQRGDLAGAEAMDREALAMERKLLGDEHPDIATLINNLGQILAQRGDLDGAEAMQRKALAMQRKLLGNEHPAVATALNNLALTLQARGNLHEAEAMLREALAMQRKLLGDVHPDIATTLYNLATVLAKRGDLTGAEKVNRDALAMQRKVLGNDHPAVATALANLAGILALRGDVAGADDAAEEALRMQRRMLGNEHPDIARTLEILAPVLMVRGDTAGAKAALAEAIALKRRLHTDTDADFAALLLLGGVFALQSHDLAGAEAQLLESWKILESASAMPDPKLRPAVSEMLVRLYKEWSKSDPTKAKAAEGWKKRAKEVGEIQATAGPALNDPSSGPMQEYRNVKTADSAILRVIAQRDQPKSPIEFVVAPPIPVMMVEKIDGALVTHGNDTVPFPLSTATNALTAAHDILSLTIGRDPFELYVAPGTRWVRISIMVAHFGYQDRAEEAIPIDFKSGAIYHLSAEAGGNDFDVTLWDATQGKDKRVLLKTWRLAAYRITYPWHIPDKAPTKP